MSQSYEYNFDGLIGPTHNFAGLAIGNLASQENRNVISHPRKAALQGLYKVKLLHQLGVKQALIPPQERPSLIALRRMGYTGQDKTVLERASQKDLELFLKCCSASSMWTANAATVSPSVDTLDHRVHITPANLQTIEHRSFEVPETTEILRIIFADQRFFTVHSPLESHPDHSDEGAANQMRICESPGRPGINCFIYGRREDLSPDLMPQRFPARQSYEASFLISHGHQLDRGKSIFIQQNPAVIDQGVFHNDVIAVNNENVLLYHEQAFVDKTEFINALSAQFHSVAPKKLFILEVKAAQLSVKEAVQTYLFNSQIVTLPDQTMVLIVPQECQEQEKTQHIINEIISQDNPLTQVYFVDLEESMRNGGGPACLRLRIVLNEAEAKAIPKGFLITDQKLTVLENWIKRFYRDRLEINDLRDHQLLKETRNVLDQLTQILNLGSIYNFQKC